jgi:hypothetical protein
MTSIQPTMNAQPAETPAASPVDHNHISIDDLKKIRGGVGEPSTPTMSAVEKSDEDFAKPVA